MNAKKRVILNKMVKTDWDEIEVEGDINPSGTWTNLMHGARYIWTLDSTLFYGGDPERPDNAFFRFDNEGAMNRYIQREGIASKINQTMREFDKMGIEFDY